MDQLKTYYIYVIFLLDDNVYIGSTNNYFRRIDKHKCKHGPNIRSTNILYNGTMTSYEARDKERKYINIFKDKYKHFKVLNINNPNGHYDIEVYRKNDNIRHQKFYINNKDRLLEKMKNYYINNKDHINEKRRNKYNNNKDRILERHRTYYINNKDRILERKRQLYKERKLNINKLI